MPKRTDANHAQIGRGLRQARFDVLDTHELGGFVDYVVGAFGRTFLVECKTEDGRLTLGQSTLLETWKGGPILVVRSAEDAIGQIERALEGR